jgi:hypothetical protein
MEAFGIDAKVVWEETRNLRIKHDIQVIYAAHNLKQCEFNRSLLTVLSTDFASVTDLYQYILNELKQYEIDDIMEIMPLIDDYLEYYENLFSGGAPLWGAPQQKLHQNL